MLIGLAVVAILAVVVGVVLFMKREHFETLCPTGLQLSINGKACVLPGEKLPPCNEDQVFTDNVCRQRLPYSYSLQRMPGWTFNNTLTGIKPAM
jgi:hypothetical protein